MARCFSKIAGMVGGGFVRIHTRMLAIIRDKADTNMQLSLAMGFGVMMGIVPAWGFQMMIALVLAHLLRLNKAIVLIFSNISIPPMIPFILFASLQTGSLILYGDFLPVVPSAVTRECCLKFFSSYLLGSVVLALVCGFLTFVISFYLLRFVRGKIQMSIEDYLPQRPPILLLKKILSHDENSISCQVNKKSLSFFCDKDDDFLGAALVEIIAQTAAVMHGLQREKNHKRLALGMLTALKEFEICEALAPGNEIIVGQVKTESAMGQHQVVRGEIYQGKKLVAHGLIFLYLDEGQNRDLAN